MHPILQSGVIALALALGTGVGFAAPTEPFEKASPMEALRLATSLGEADIESVDDPEGWWADTKVRSWTVLRMAGPGIDDTTHDFIVIYVVDGTPLLQWSVDTRAGTIERVEEGGYTGCTFSTTQWCPPKDDAVKSGATQ